MGSLGVMFIFKSRQSKSLDYEKEHMIIQLIFFAYNVRKTQSS